MRKLLAAILLVGGIVMLASSFINAKPRIDKTTDSYVRDRVVMLYSPIGSCTGVQIKAPSGAIYILSAAHCHEIEIKGRMYAQSEQGKRSIVHEVAIDPVHDLLLLSTRETQYIDIASTAYIHEHVHTMTHGHGMPSYRTDGEFLEERDAKIAEFEIMTPQDEKKCLSMPRHFIIPAVFIFPEMCIKSLRCMMSTAMVVPGSSGGPVLDDNGRLVGIVSNTDGTFSGFIPLRDIKSFLRNK